MDAHMRRWNELSLIEAMACFALGIKYLPKYMIIPEIGETQQKRFETHMRLGLGLLFFCGGDFEFRGVRGGLTFQYSVYKSILRVLT